jgi:4-hydroxy-2-oxovalerate aldolase
MKKDKIEIFDATIRDGGYLNNYDFSLDKVEVICMGLEKNGVNWIEIGHGYGIGGERVFGKMAATDVEYLEKMQGKLKKAKLGMFANANLATKNDVDIASKYGLNFLRIGFIGYMDPHPFNAALDLVEYVKSRGMLATINIVKTHMYTTKQLKGIAKDATRAGANMIYIVDSAGCMLPNQVTQITKNLKEVTDVKIGFHGHQNLTLAVANSIAAVQAGATFVDGTLLGIGRQPGNAQLELLVLALKKCGYTLEIDELSLSNLAAKELQPILKESKGIKLDEIILSKFGMLNHAIPIAKELAKIEGLDYLDILDLVNKSNIHFENKIDFLKIIKGNNEK